ncbi:MAG TPA: hypothetical protein VE972_10315 [Conexibacter sp.]|nr:hypothetical protein [Conexibacter sp.]
MIDRDVLAWRGASVAGMCIALVFAAFTGLSSAALPDGRVYEQVTPAQKRGADVISNPDRVRAAAGGGAIMFPSLTGFGDVRGTGVSTEYMSVRDDRGRWKTHGITPPQEPTSYLETALASLEPRYVGEMSPDLSRGVFLAKSPLGDSPNVAGAVNLYMRDDLLSSGAGMYELVSDATTMQGTDANNKPWVAAASANFSHVLFESMRNLTDDAVSAGLDTSEPKLYEWVSGTVRLAGILPAAEGGTATVAQAGQGAVQKRYTNGTISQDGRYVVFTGPPYADNHTSGVVYMRDDQGTLPTGDDTTTRISASERTDCDGDPTCGGDGIADPLPDPAYSGGPPPPATYWAASADGTQIFFTTSEQLADSDTNGASDLYRYDVNAPAGHHLTQLSIVNQPGGQSGGVSGVIGASADGSYVYFTGAQFVPGGPTGDTGGPVGGVRISVWHNGGIHEVGAVNDGTEFRRILGNMGWGADPKWSRVTPDGKHMIFETQGTRELLSLYGRPEYDHGNSCPSKAGFVSFECREIYVYDATANGGAGNLQCASCNPTGQAATAEADLYTNNSSFGVSLDTSHLNRPLSDDGRFVFFNSDEQLTTDDHNTATDVYEFDTVTGQVHLISGGAGSGASVFVDASGDGHDVYFTTRDRLRSTDIDQARDLYDARVGGLADSGTPVFVPCGGDGCRLPVSAHPTPPVPPTVRADGAGDALEPPGPLGVFFVKPLGVRQRRQLIRRGITRLTIAVSQPGMLRVRVTASLGGPRRIQAITRTLRHGARLRLRLRLSRAARSELARRGRLRLTVTASYSQDPSPQTLHIALRTAHA